MTRVTQTTRNKYAMNAKSTLQKYEREWIKWRNQQSSQNTTSEAASVRCVHCVWWKLGLILNVSVQHRRQQPRAFVIYSNVSRRWSQRRADVCNLCEAGFNSLPLPTPRQLRSILSALSASMLLLPVAWTTASATASCIPSCGRSPSFSSVCA